MRIFTSRTKSYVVAELKAPAVINVKITWTYEFADGTSYYSSLHYSMGRKPKDFFDKFGKVITT